MLHAISWKEFLTLMGLGVLFYYVCLIMKYFPAGMRLNTARGRKSMDEPPAVERVPDDFELAPGSRLEQEKSERESKADATQLALPLPEEGRKPLKELAEAVCSEVTALLEQAGRENMARGEIIYAVQSLLDKEGYRPLKSSFFQDKISEIIGSGLNRYCSIQLDAVELSGLWIR